jgi:hypothetical protein
MRSSRHVHSAAKPGHHTVNWASAADNGWL